MKRKLLDQMNKADMRGILKQLDIEGMESKPLATCRKKLQEFSYNQIVSAYREM